MFVEHGSSGDDDDDDYAMPGPLKMAATHASGAVARVASAVAARRPIAGRSQCACAFF